MRIHHRKHKAPGFPAQAMVEFAIVLPILLMLLMGILEVGRLIFMYAAVNNASREAARYGSAIGLDDAGYSKYRHCAGIKDAAQRSAFFTPLIITISYDHGPGSTSTIPNCTATAGEDPNINVSSGDRVLITVSANYSPMVNLIPIGSRTLTSSSARTIIGSLDLENLTSPSSTPGSSGPTAIGTIFPTSTFTSTATATVVSVTPTVTRPGEVVTMTPLPSSTPTMVPSSTPTATSTATATSTSTPTSTSTSSASCNTITAGNISVIDGTNVISMTVTNPYIDVTVSSVTLTWPENGGNSDPKTLTLDSANLNTTYWSGINNSSGTTTLTPASTLALPGNNRQSKITFTFVQNYTASNMSGTTTITINFSTPGCSAITKIAN